MTHRFPSPLLVIEASSGAGSIALVVDNVVVADRAVVMGPSRDDALLPAIAEVLHESALAARDIRAIACGSGPGSFTSLRIAASLAKGMAVATKATLYAIPSLLLAAGVLRTTPGIYMLHSDALRSERYVVRVIVANDGSLQMSNVTRLSLDEVVRESDAECATLIAVGSAASANDAQVLQPLARNVVLLDNLWDTFGPVSVELWEPDYGRLAEAQVKWESTHGRVLPVG